MATEKELTCKQCHKLQTSMWGNICNTCRAENEHRSQQPTKRELFAKDVLCSLLSNPYYAEKASESLKRWPDPDKEYDIVPSFDIRDQDDNRRFRSGNYFLTKKAATAALRSVRKTLRQSEKGE